MKQGSCQLLLKCHQGKDSPVCCRKALAAFAPAPAGLCVTQKASLSVKSTEVQCISWPLGLSSGLLLSHLCPIHTSQYVHGTSTPFPNPPQAGKSLLHFCGGSCITGVTSMSRCGVYNRESDVLRIFLKSKIQECNSSFRLSPSLVCFGFFFPAVHSLRKILMTFSESTKVESTTNF